MISISIYICIKYLHDIVRQCRLALFCLPTTYQHCWSSRRSHLWCIDSRLGMWSVIVSNIEIDLKLLHLFGNIFLRRKLFIAIQIPSHGRDHIADTQLSRCGILCRRMDVADWCCVRKYRCRSRRNHLSIVRITFQRVCISFVGNKFSWVDWNL